MSEHAAQTRAREVLHSMRQVHRSMNTLMRMQADQLGVTPVQMLVMRALEEEPNLSLGELSERVALGCSTVSGVVKRLVESGLVHRDRLDEDQRTVAIRLTDAGQQLVAEAYGDESLLSRALLRFVELPPEDVTALLNLNAELIRILDPEAQGTPRVSTAGTPIDDGTCR